MLEVSDPRNCSVMLTDPPDHLGGIPNYSEERCTVDRQENPTMLACGWVNAGVRVFDVRDLLHPKEIAYYKSPAPRTAFLPGSGSWTQGTDRTVDKIAGYMRFYKRSPGHDKAEGNGNSQGQNGNGQGNGNDNGQGNGNDNGTDMELWIVSDGNGFQILHFTDSFKKNNTDLFEDSDD